MRGRQHRHAGFFGHLQSAADGARLRLVADFSLQTIDGLATGLAHDDARLESIERAGGFRLQLLPLRIGAVSG